MNIITSNIVLSTKGNADVLDITEAVAQMIRQSGLTDGIVTVFCPSSTSALTTIEYESGVVNDLRRMFDEIIPPNHAYQHDDAWGDGNGHSHVRAALLKPSLTVPFVNSRMTLGTWQQMIFVDFDIRSRQRELIIQVLGE